MQKLGVCGICQQSRIPLETYGGHEPCECDKVGCASCADRSRNGGWVLASHLISGQPCEGAGRQPEYVFPD